MDDQDVERQAHEQRRETSELDATWGGLNLSVRGSIVVLALLIIAGTGAILWFSGLQNTHFDDLISANERHMLRQDDMLMSHSVQMSELRTTFTVQIQEVEREIERNRIFLREIEKVCMLTPAQRERLQQNLSPAMRELLHGGEFGEPNHRK